MSTEEKHYCDICYTTRNVKEVYPYAKNNWYCGYCLKNRKSQIPKKPK